MGLLSNVKLIAGGVVVALLVGIGLHYRHVINERDQLEVENTAYQQALSIAADNMEKLAEDKRLAEEAANAALAQRDANFAALENLRAARRNDPETAAWSDEPLPIEEISRLCTALPDMEGCQ